MPDRSETSHTRPLMAGGASHVLVRRFHLRVMDGPDRGAERWSDGERTVIGTDAGADFVLRDPTVSRFHCEITITGGKAILRDLGSRNGTRLDRVSIREAELDGEATIGIGKTQVRFALGDEQVEVPLFPEERFGKMAGRSRSMRAVFAVLDRAARSEATVLLQGETGTGKDVAAESIHETSARRSGPFVAIDCGAIPGALLESELFGHQRGAFTGATSSRVGAFQQATSGTLFLDEIGELGLDLQPKLLRVLESRKVRPVGGTKSVPVDVRIIAATNRDLHDDVSAGRFRADLYYRLAVLEVRLPPLHERPEDVPLLVEALVERIGGAPEAVTESLRSPAVLAELATRRWPGNVRELRNWLERCVALETTTPPPTRSPARAAPEVDVSQPLKVARDRAIQEFEHRYLAQLLREHDDNVSAAARAAGVDRVHLHRLLVRAKLR